MPSLAVDEILRVGNFMFSRTSCRILLGGIPYTGVLDISWEESREGELQYGQRTDGTPLGYTSGLYTPGALTWKMYVDSGEMFLQQLTVLGFGSFGSVSFPFIIEISESAENPSMTFAFNGVKIEKRKLAVPTDTSGLMYEFEAKYLSAGVVGAGMGLTGLPTQLANVGQITNGI
jgi:hypothetical protein